MYTQELKRHTERVHRELEQRLIPIIQNIKHMSDYAALLKTFFGFYAPLEKRLSDLTEIDDIIKGVRLRKAESLRADFETIEASPENVALCDDLPKITDASSALGVLYVLEGSTLGGKAIAGIIRRNLATETNIPFSFFLYYGDDTKQQWDEFRHKLDSASNLSGPDLLASASETFSLFKRWIERTTVLPDQAMGYRSGGHISSETHQR